MSGVLFMLAAALVVWPTGAAVGRLRALAPAPRPRITLARDLLERVPARVLCPFVAGVAGLLFAGPLHACAAAVLGAVAVDLRTKAAARRARLSRLGAWDRALDDVASALRAGARPGNALRRAATAAGETDAQVAGVLTAAGAHARLGGDVAAALRSSGAPASPGAPTDSPQSGAVPDAESDRIPAELAGAWLLATRHGVVLADVVDGLRADVAGRRERAVRVDATLAGPRATAVILTALPALGVLLGSGFGADPLGVLLGGTLGGALCLAGAVFLAAGLLWTDRIVGGAAR